MDCKEHSLWQTHKIVLIDYFNFRVSPMLELTLREMYLNFTHGL